MLAEGPGPSESESSFFDITPPPPSSSVSSSPSPSDSDSLFPPPSASPSTKQASLQLQLPKPTHSPCSSEQHGNNDTSSSTINSSSSNKSQGKKKSINGSQSQSDLNSEYYTQDTTEEANIDMGLSTLPYDLLLNIATYLDLRDVHALQLTCRSLYDASTTRPVYRKLANDLLRRCRALPLKGFQRLADLSTENLIHAVNKANHYEAAWRVRAPRPIGSEPIGVGVGVSGEADASGVNRHSNYMDVCKRGGRLSVGGRLRRHLEAQSQSPISQNADKSKDSKPNRSWYKIVSAPPGEEVDWLSPITSSYTLCATKSGKVVCWDVQSDTCLAEWNPGARWELWKCRVEFEERTVFFTMAKVLTGSYDDDRIMKFVLMRLTFSDGPTGESSIHPPVFSRVTEFRTTGVVMNVFLLDPSERLLSAFIWVSTSNTIGLYALLDWGKREYVFVDTGIECVMSSNWSCILYQQHIVIHCEESDAAFQHFYPLSLLRNYISTLPEGEPESSPVISRRVPPARTLKKKFIFPRIGGAGGVDEEEEGEEGEGDGEQEAEAEEGQEQPLGYQHVNGDINGTSSSSSSSPSPASSSSSLSLSSVTSLNTTTAASVQTQTNQTLITTTTTTSTSTSTSNTTTTTSSTPTPTQTQTPNPNPYPFPPWYPESAHFVRQWWPTLPNIPRVSCTVVLLAAHDQTTHRTRFVLAQHYFRVPLDHREWEVGVAEEAVGVVDGRLRSSSASSSSSSTPSSSSGGGGGGGQHQHTLDSSSSSEKTNEDEDAARRQDDALMHLWYVSTPFEVVRVLDGPEEDDDGTQAERPRPLVAVDFGHAVWIEYADVDGDGVDGGGEGTGMDEEDGEEGSEEGEGDSEDEDEENAEFGMDVAMGGPGSAQPNGTNTTTNASANTNTNGNANGNANGHANRIQIVDNEPKALRFVTFPPFSEEYGVELDRRYSSSSSSANSNNKASQSTSNKNRESGVPSTSASASASASASSSSNNASSSSSSNSNGNGSGRGGSRSTDTNTRVYNANSRSARDNPSSVSSGMEGQVRTLEIPDELDLGSVETINIDQSQGAIILSDKSGRIFILCYE